MVKARGQSTKEPRQMAYLLKEHDQMTRPWGQFTKELNRITNVFKSSVEWPTFLKSTIKWSGLEANLQNARLNDLCT